jgi:hypothetical protein
VLLVERRRFPRWKVCGACLSGQALAALEQAGQGPLLDQLGARPLRSLQLGLEGARAELALPAGRVLSRLALDDGFLLTNQWSRYQAYVDSASTVDVLASRTNVTATVADNLVQFTIPSGTRLSSARIRWNGSVSTTFAVDVGTTDMGNSTVTNRWVPTVSGYREDSGAVLELTPSLDVTNMTRVFVGPVITSVWNAVKLDW